MKHLIIEKLFDHLIQSQYVSAVKVIPYPSLLVDYLLWTFQTISIIFPRLIFLLP